MKLLWKLRYYKVAFENNTVEYSMSIYNFSFLNSADKMAVSPRA